MVCINLEKEDKKCIGKKCIKQRVLTAGRNVKFPSNPTATDQFTAGNATLNADPPVDSKRLHPAFLGFYLFIRVSVSQICSGRDG